MLKSRKCLLYKKRVYNKKSIKKSNKKLRKFRKLRKLKGGSNLPKLSEIDIKKYDNLVVHIGGACNKRENDIDIDTYSKSCHKMKNLESLKRTTLYLIIDPSQNVDTQKNDTNNSVYKYIKKQIEDILSDLLEIVNYFLEKKKKVVVIDSISYYKGQDYNLDEDSYDKLEELYKLSIGNETKFLIFKEFYVQKNIIDAISIGGRMAVINSFFDTHCNYSFVGYLYKYLCTVSNQSKLEGIKSPPHLLRLFNESNKTFGDLLDFIIDERFNKNNMINEPFLKIYRKIKKGEFKC
jgi:hypothetical protein